MKMKLLYLVFFVGLVSSTLGNPEASVAVRQRRDVDFLANTRVLIQQLIENLGKAAQQARDAIAQFVSGMQQQVEAFGQKIRDDIDKLRNGIQNAIKNIIDRITGAGPAVRACIQKQQAAAEQLFANAQAQTDQCADQNVADIQNMVDRLSALADNAVDYTRNVVEQMENCNKNNTGLLNAGACLGRLVARTEFNGLQFAAQSSVMMSRINLSLLTLPAALEVCAGRSLIAAGSEARSIMSEIASCSYSSIFSSNEIPF